MSKGIFARVATSRTRATTAEELNKRLQSMWEHKLEGRPVDSGVFVVETSYLGGIQVIVGKLGFKK